MNVLTVCEDIVAEPYTFSNKIKLINKERMIRFVSKDGSQHDQRAMHQMESYVRNMFMTSNHCSLRFGEMSSPSRNN